MQKYKNQWGHYWMLLFGRHFTYHFEFFPSLLGRVSLTKARAMAIGTKPLKVMSAYVFASCIDLQSSGPIICAVALVVTLFWSFSLSDHEEQNLNKTKKSISDLKSNSIGDTNIIRNNPGQYWLWAFWQVWVNCFHIAFQPVFHVRQVSPQTMCS